MYFPSNNHPLGGADPFDLVLGCPFSIRARSTGEEIYSSDFAMQYALAARGWRIAPWEETAQMDKDKVWCGPWGGWVKKRFFLSLCFWEGGSQITEALTLLGHMDGSFAMRSRP